MKILLTALNAKYIHSNPAIYSLKRYAKDYGDHIFLAEFTINNQVDDILSSIYKQRPEVLAFSCYIWNISMIEEIIREYRKLDSQVKIWVGGPEVSYDAEEFLNRNTAVDGVMIGEGEETFLELTKHYVDQSIELCEVAGLAYRTDQGNSAVTKARIPLTFGRLPFLYDFMKEEEQDAETFDHRIIYYETSRGCPFSCSYCLSSIDKRVRLRDIDLVKQELQMFLDRRVAQVKFIDRTFNANKSHAMEIWHYIKEHDNGITNFHFEIAADILDKEEIELLNTLRPGLVQLEIGVQSTNALTIQAIHRTMNLEKLKRNVAQIHHGNNIHQHLDLIAGLPYEDYASFGKSFDEVYEMKPDQLQLGFLKVLKGSLMRDMAEEYGIVYKDSAPYEVLYTRWLSYDDVIRLKEIEDMVEVYYNSGQFTASISFLKQFFPGAFSMYERLAFYYDKHGLFGMNHARLRRYDILREFVREEEILTEEQQKTLDEILIYDLYLREKLKSRPAFADSNDLYKQQYKEYIAERQKGSLLSSSVHIEHFNVDVEAVLRGDTDAKRECFIIFDYSERNPLTQAAKTTVLERTSLGKGIS